MMSARFSSLLLFLHCFCGGLVEARWGCDVEVFWVLLLFSGDGEDGVDTSRVGFLNFSVIGVVSFCGLLSLFLLRGIVDRWSFNVFDSSF
jgi:hypothetical protein